MENSAPAATTVGCRREPSTDPVKSQGILASVTRKSRDAARLWHDKWGFYSQIPKIREEEAQKIGMSVKEYKEAILSRSCQPDCFECPVEVLTSPTALQPTSSGVIGRRAQCPLEQYGRLVKTARDFPTRVTLKPGQVYDPYKQTLMFLGSVEGDPISYKLPPSRCEVTDDMWARPQQLNVTPLDKLEFLPQN